VKVVFVKYPDECCPHGCAQHTRCCSEWLDGTLVGRAWWAFRCAMYRLIENKYFETFIILMILASSLSLVLSQLIYARMTLRLFVNNPAICDGVLLTAT